MRLYNTFLGGIILLFLSCSDEKSVQTVSLPDALELQSTTKNIDVDLLLPTKIFIKNNKIVVFEPLTKDMFKVFNFPSFRYLYSFGDKGGGPNEFVSISNDAIIENDTDFIEIFDVNKLKYVDFSDSSAHITAAMPISLLHLKNPINRFKKLNDSIYYFDNILEDDQKNEFTRLNIHSGVRSYFSPYPDWAKNINIPEQKYQLYLKFSNSNFFYNQTAVFYYRFPVVKFLDNAGNVIKEVHINVPQPTISKHSNDDVFYFIEYPVLTDEFIYVLWVEKSKNDIMNNPENFRPEILAFDWDGNVAGRYKLDKSIITFTISEETGKIYCTPFPGEDVINYIYEYDLPKIDNAGIGLTQIQNTVYSSDILDGYTFFQASMEDGIDKIVEKKRF
ncbi:MAG: TolB-like 6-bladed beta-propeller domain-containing protein [Bacteroidales bacterium]|jgi:hypothetical protein|nr:TolB-like 6-bladed beta-propeller domain-containing protein [Bacteroidales bacterium]